MGSTSLSSMSFRSVVAVIGWYVSVFQVKPNELVREQPYIADNIQMTRQAYGLDKFEQHEFPICGRGDRLVCKRLSGEAERTGARAALYRGQYPDDAAGVWARQV